MYRITAAFVVAFSSSCATGNLEYRSDQLVPESFVEEIPGTALKLELCLIQALALDAAHVVRANGESTAELLPQQDFWISSTEIPWELYDAFVYEEEAAGADAITRPTKPYISVDRGFGHNGYPAMSISVKGARAFCVWLSAKTNKTYRLPTEREWRAAALGSAQMLSNPKFAAAQIEAGSWHAGNAQGRTHPVGAKDPNSWGLYDIFGNVAEWCEDERGRPFIAGGCFLDAPGKLNAEELRRPSPAWNVSDPQIPKSPWWLADAPFVGFRVVRTL